MTFKDISIKMFKSNFRRYLLYFLCSSFTVMIFFMYSTLFTNKTFMDSPKINQSITYNIIAPSFLLGLFSIFFITYSQSSFNKFRKPEYGLLMVLGLTNKDIRKIIWLENSMIAGGSLTVGLILGSIVSKIFHLIIMKIVDLNGVKLTLTFNSYLYTILFFIIIYAVVIIISMVLSFRYEIINLLKELRKEDSGMKISPIFIVIGIILIVIAVIDMLKNYTVKDSFPMLRSMLTCFAGIYLLVSNMVWINSKISHLSKKIYCKNLIFNSNVKYTFGKSKNVMFIIICLMSITIMFGGMGATTTADSKRLVTAYTPYHIAYSDFYSLNKVTEKEFNDITKNSATPLTVRKKLEFLSQPSMYIFSSKKLNYFFKCNIHVKKGHFIQLFQVIKNDVYPHEYPQIRELVVRLKNDKTISFMPQGKYIKMLFNGLSNEFCVILNDNDYISLRKKIRSTEVGYLNLLNFKDWKKTKGIVNRFTKILGKGQTDLTVRGLIDSRIKYYTEDHQSCSFLLFLLCFVSLLFFVASTIMIHFKLLTEFELEKVKYKKLYKIGISKSEVTKIVSRELKVIFLVPAFFAIIIATFYLYSASLGRGIEIVALKSIIGIGLLYLIIQVISYFIYKKYYIDKLCKGAFKL